MVKRFRTGDQTLAREFSRSFVVNQCRMRRLSRADFVVLARLIKTTAQ
jgi:hypothetical protein